MNFGFKFLCKQQSGTHTNKHTQTHLSLTLSTTICWATHAVTSMSSIRAWEKQLSSSAYQWMPVIFFVFSSSSCFGPSPSLAFNYKGVCCVVLVSWHCCCSSCCCSCCYCGISNFPLDKFYMTELWYEPWPSQVQALS